MSSVELCGGTYVSRTRLVPTSPTWWLRAPFHDVERVEFKHSQTLTRDGLYRRVLTTSYVSVMEGQEREALMKDVALVVEHQPEPIVLPYVTSVYTARATMPNA